MTERPRPPFVNVRLVRPDAQMPVRGSAEAAGLDLFAAERKMLFPGKATTVPTGIAIDLPQGWFAQVNPRTGLAVKHGVGVLAGVVDSDYRGEIDVIMFVLGHSIGARYTVERGDRVAQLVIMPCCSQRWKLDVISHGIETYREAPSSWQLREVSELSQTERGAGRFGSTGTGGEPEKGE